MPREFPGHVKRILAISVHNHTPRESKDHVICEDLHGAGLAISGCEFIHHDHVSYTDTF